MITLQQSKDGFEFNIKDEEGHNATTDAAEAIGGTNNGMRPMQLFLGSLAACSSIDVVLILKKQKLEQIGLEVSAKGERPDTTPAPFNAIHLTFSFASHIPQNKAERAVDLSVNKLCSVREMLKEEINITFDVIIRQEE